MSLLPFQSAWCRASSIIAVAAAVSWSCGGSTATDSTDDTVRGDASDRAGSTGARASGGNGAGSGGRAAAGGISAGGGPGTGGVSAAGGTASTDASAGVSDCPIRVSGTPLKEEDCYPCLPPGTTCESVNVSPDFDAEGCLNIIRHNGTLYCEWYADGDPFTKPWGAVVTCRSSNPGRVVCGGGL